MSFLESYLDDNYKVSEEDIQIIVDFLLFISTPEELVTKISETIKKTETDPSSPRKLNPVIDYLVLEDAINSLYNGAIDDTTFVKYFPIYFWVNITFILPLRATEILLTPYECIGVEEGEKKLTVRRTLLKKKHLRVYYDVEKDYQIFTYSIPDNGVAKNIEKYIEMTKYHKRKYLFDFDYYTINDMFSLRCFNALLRDFFELYVKENTKYEFVNNSSRLSNLNAFAIKINLPAGGDAFPDSYLETTLTVTPIASAKSFCDKLFFKRNSFIRIGFTESLLSKCKNGQIYNPFKYSNK